MSAERELRHTLRTCSGAGMTEGIIDGIAAVMRPVFKRLNEVECELAVLRRRLAQRPGLKSPARSSDRRSRNREKW